MTRRGLRPDDVERLLREALADDLPRDVEGRLRTAMRSSWRTASSEASAAVFAKNRADVGPRALGTWSPQRAFLAAAALLTAVAGTVLHLEAGAGPVVEPFLAQQTATRVASQLHRVSSMGCQLETRDPDGRALRFAIDWRDTGETEVRIETPGSTQYRTVHLPRETASFLVLARQGPARAMSSPDDPELDPAGGHLTPERLAGLLAGRWELVRGPSEARPGVATFSISTPRRRNAVRVTIDTQTHLPLSVEQALPGSELPGPGQMSWAHARFVWEPPPPSPGLLRGHARPGAARGRPTWS